VNGNVLIAAAPVTGASDDYLSPTSFFETEGRRFESLGTANKINRLWVTLSWYDPANNHQGARWGARPPPGCSTDRGVPTGEVTLALPVKSPLSGSSPAAGHPRPFAGSK